MTAENIAWLILPCFMAGCDRVGHDGRFNVPVTTSQRILEAKEDLSQAYEQFNAFPKLDVIVRATRGFVIIRQVEISTGELESVTREELRHAKHRSAAVLARLSVFEPQLRKIERSLLDLRGSLHHLASQADLTPESRSSIMRCRSRVGEAVAEMDLVFRVLCEPESVYPGDSDYFDPDFTGCLCEVESTLRYLRLKGAQ